MAENNWKTPAAVIGILTVLVSVGGLYYKQREDELSKRRQEYQEQIEKQRQEEQKHTEYVKQMREDEKERERQKVRQDKIDVINAQIAEVDKQIEHCRSEVGSAYWEYGKCMEKGEGNCEVYSEKHKHYNDEWKKLENDKKDLQKQLTFL